MRNVALVLLALVVMAGSGRAEVYTMYTGPNAKGPSVGSSVTPTFNIANIYSVQMGAIDVMGSMPVDMNLDASNSGPLRMPGGSLGLGDSSFSRTVGAIFQFPGLFSVSFNDVRMAVQSGSISVNNGSFTIDSSTSGLLSINQGTMEFSIPLVFFNFSLTGVVDFAVTPLTFSFSALGTRTIAGTADDDLGGFDTVDGDPHSLGGAGLTGLSAIDTDGSEMRLSFTGLSVPSTIVSGTWNLPVTINLSGSIAVGVPELGSMMLAGMGSVGLVGLMLRRRK